MSSPIELIGRLWRRLVYYVRRDRFERELAEEVRFHMELRAEHNRHAGMSADDARFDAMRRFGNSTLVREEARQAMTVAWLETLSQDLRYTARSLRKRPTFAGVVIVTLALGLGGATAMFSVINTVLLKPLPFPTPERLMTVWEWREGAEGSTHPNVVAPTNLRDWMAQQNVFAELAGMFTHSVNLTGLEEPEEVQAALASPGVFRALGVSPLVGRGFTEEDGKEGAPQIAVLTESAWRRRFGGDPSAVGRTITVNDQSVTLVGVVPASVGLVAPAAELWFPFAFHGYTRSNSGRFIRVVGRLADGVSVERAEAQMSTIAQRLEREYPEFNAGWGIKVIPIHTQLVGNVRPALLVLFGAVAVLLLIAATNVSNVMLAHASARRQEMAIRTALGAGRGRVLRQLLTESLLLSLLGAVLGVLLARWGVSALVAMLPDSLNIPRATEIGVDLRVLGFATAVALLTGILFGLAPAIESAKTSVTSALREEGRGMVAGRRSLRFRNLLAITQMALALVLLAGSGLLIRSFIRLQQVSIGFDPSNLLTFRVNRAGGGPGASQRRVAFFEEVRQRVETLPGVVSASGLWFLPLSGDVSKTGFTVEGRPTPDPKDVPGTGVLGVQPGYFETMRIPLRNGRTFAAQDHRDDAPNFGVINEAMARQHWPGEDPVGKRIGLEWGENFSIEIVGVVGDVRFEGLGVEPGPELYLPYAQLPAFPYETFVVRTAGDPRTLGPTISREIRAIDANQPVTKIQPMYDVLANSVAQPRLYTILLGTFAALALVLAAVGIYGVLSYSVAQRRHEIGIRVALGADRGSVLGLVLRHVTGLALIGVLIGTLSALALTRLMSSLLYNVSASDPLTFAAVAIVLTTVALVAAYLPALRAARVDPMEALRG